MQLKNYKKDRHTGMGGKSPIHAGGRGKAGGVKVATSLDAVKEKATAILGMNLVSRQTGPQGKIVHKNIDSAGCILPGTGQDI